ncbi:MAG: chromosomal replication initiator protein DnaA, partial [Dongiaceae bacterium]
MPRVLSTAAAKEVFSLAPAPAPVVDEKVLQEGWTKIRTTLRHELGETIYRNWVKPLSLIGLKAGQIQMAVPSRLIRDWVLSRYGDRLRALWTHQEPSIRSIEILVKATLEAANDSEEAAANPPMPQRLADTARNAPYEPGRDPLSVGAPLDPRFTLESFVVGKPNELAYAAAKRVVESPDVPFNPLFLYGGVGLGKTHLMHAIAWAILKKDPKKRVLYLSAEKFMFQFIRALRFKDTVSFKELFRSVDVLMIDDVQFIGGKDSTQEEFFHTFNALVDNNRQVIVSADKSPSDLEGLEERLRSRLGWGLVADIHPTNYELRLSILQSKALALKINVPVPVMEFLAHKITSNVRELEGALNRIAAHASLVGRDVTMETAQELLRDLLRASERRITIEDIQKRVAEHYNIRLTDMHAARRARAVARPRQVAMYLAKQLTQRSLPEIGRKFGGRDHTTVMHAVRKIEELCGLDPSFGEDVQILR